MACDEWKERIVSELYGELDEPERMELRAHLENCGPCRIERDEVAGTRSLLVDASPEIPPSRHVVVLDGTARVRPGFRGFAAGFAAATVLLAAGWLVGRAGGPGGARLADPVDDGAIPIAEYIDRDTLQRALDAQHDEFRSLLDRPEGDVVPAADLDTTLVNLQTAWEHQRREDLEFVLKEIVAAEVRSGAAIGENRQALRYIALSDRADLTEW